MMRFQAKRSKSTQYMVGGAVAVIILGLWISIPLMNGSSLDSSFSTTNPFKSKVADISSLGSDIPSEGGAPGSPLSGEMINNPATSGDETASSLFQSGIAGEEPAAEAASAAAGAAPAPLPPAPAGAPAPSKMAEKLRAAPSIGSGNSNSMTAGGSHSKFFGSGNQKAEFAPLTNPNLPSAHDKKNSLVSMLTNTAEKSMQAAKNGNMDSAKGGAASAFSNTAKADASSLNNTLEGKAVESGLQLGQTAQDLKKSDPSLSKNKVTAPSAPEEEKDTSEEFKNQVTKMIIEAVLKIALTTVLGV